MVTITEEQKKLIQAKHRLEEAQMRNREKERKARTRRLIQKGALVEKYCPTWKEARRLLSIMPLDFMDKRKQDADDDESNIERYL